MSSFDPYATLTPGSELVYENLSYFLTVRTPDGRYMAMTSGGVILLMPDPLTGIPAFPTVAMLREAQRTRKLVLRSDPLDDPVRQQARLEEATAEEVEARDSWAPLRRAVIRLWKLEPEIAKPMLSDARLLDWLGSVLDLEEIKARHGRVPCGTTLRTWVRTRGKGHDRRMVDMESRSGRVPRRRKIDPVVLAIGKAHALAVAKRDKRRRQKTGYQLFERDVARANKGLEVKVDGLAIEYERPAKPFKPFGPEIFRQECHRAKGLATTKAAWGENGARAVYRGGGKAKEPTRFLEIVEQDDTPFPKWFLIDLENRVPVGVPTAVFTMDIYSRVFIGWDVSYEKPSVSSWMRALAHCAEPKAVPERLREEFPGLADTFGFITGAMLYDNALQNVSRAVEDAGGDLCHEVRLAGEGEATHKAHVERAHQTVQKLMAEVPGSTFSIAHLRKYGYDPARHTLVTIEEFRVLLAEAIATYHVTPSDALDDRTPLDVWQEQIALHGLSQARDVDQFLRSIADVDYYTFSRSGCEIDGLAYSGDDGADPGNANLLSDLASALGPSRNTDDPRFRVKVKKYPNDLGFVSVWNPLSRRYVNVPCTRQRYAAGKPKWLHLRVKEHAALLALDFATEEQMLAAQTDFVEVVEAISPEASTRERQTMARLFDAPNVRRYLGDSVNFMRVSPSPSGMENAVGHDLRAGIRRDDMDEKPRRRRGGANVERDSRDAAKERRAARETAATVARRRGQIGTTARNGKIARKTAGTRSAGRVASRGQSTPDSKVAAAKPLSTAKFK